MTRNPLEPQGSPGERSSPEPACMGHLVSRLRSAKQLSSREATMAYLFSKTRMSPFLVQCQRGCEQPRLWEWWCLPCRSHNSHVRSRAQASPEQYLKNWVPLKAREALRTIGEQAGQPVPCLLWPRPSVLMLAPKRAQARILFLRDRQHGVYWCKYPGYARQYFQNKTKLDLK